MTSTKLFIFLSSAFCAMIGLSSFASTQTMSYLEYHKTDSKLGKFYTYINAVQKEQSYQSTHVPVYFPLNFEDFVQYLFNYVQECQYDNAYPKISALLRLVEERDVCGYLTCFQAITSSRFKQRDVPHMLSDQEIYIREHNNRPKADEIARAFNSAISRDLRSWRKGVIIQMLVPKKHAHVLQFNETVGDMSVYDMYKAIQSNPVETLQSHPTIPRVIYHHKDIENISHVSEDIHLTCFAPGVYQNIEEDIFTRLQRIAENPLSVRVSLPRKTADVVSEADDKPQLSVKKMIEIFTDSDFLAAAGCGCAIVVSAIFGLYVVQNYESWGFDSMYHDMQYA